MATDQEINDFISQADSCLAFDMDRLVSRQEWGAINFETGRDDIERIFLLVNLLRTLPLRHLPNNKLPGFTSSLKNICDALKQIDNFKIEQQDPSGVKESLVDKIRRLVDSFYDAVHIYAPYLAYQRGDVDRNIQTLTQVIKDTESYAVRASQEIKEKREEIDRIVSATREASAKAGVAHFTKDFLEEANDQNKSASTWLKRTTKAAIATFIFAFLFIIYSLFFDIPADRQIQIISSKVLLIIILISTTLWCGRMYKAAQHLYTINKHRANALTTFQAFIQATDDQQTRDAVLLETTRSIFTITASGYIEGGDGGVQDGALKVVEVVKNLTHTGS